MSQEFIKSAYNSSSINKAIIQEKQLNYLLNSKLQEDRFDDEYLKAWAERKYQTDDYFLNWVKSIFKTENFLSFFKYLRFPLPSTKIIHNRIEPQLRRVFNAEDADFKYDIKGKDFADFAEDLKVKKFNSEMFERLLYKHNSLIVSDLDPMTPNTPYRYFVDISDVKSIEEEDGKIERIAFKGCVEQPDSTTPNSDMGFIYIDCAKYAFYNSKMELINEAPHDLGFCPVHFISPKKFNGDCVIRESIFTYIREEIEEYNFIKTLQKMTEPNGAIPVVSKIKTSKPVEGNQKQGEPGSNEMMGSQKPAIYNQNKSVGTGDLQPGTIHEIPLSAIRSDDGTVNMDAVKNYLNFHYIPIESLNYLNSRISELEASIVSTIVGDFSQQSSKESAKNASQIEKSISILENTLTSFAETLNQIRKYSDYDMLALKYGKDNINEIFIHYGTDFFLDSQSKLFADLALAPNPLERKNIIVRISQNRYKNNSDQLGRQKLLYDLMPFVSDVDFNTAIAQQIVGPITKEYQLRFNYWIDQFEAYYGNIVQFYKDMETTKAEKLVLINNLITDLISKQQINLPQNEQSNLA